MAICFLVLVVFVLRKEVVSFWIVVCFVKYGVMMGEKSWWVWFSYVKPLLRMHVLKNEDGGQAEQVKPTLLFQMSRVVKSYCSLECVIQQ